MDEELLQEALRQLELASAQDAAKEAARAELRRSNPFFGIEDTADQFTDLVVQRSLGGSARDAALLGLASGLIGGFGNRLGSNLENRQLADIDRVNAAARMGQTMDRGSLPLSVFQKLEEVPSVFGRRQVAQEIADRLKEAKDLRSVVNQTIIRDPFKKQEIAEAFNIGRETVVGDTPAGAEKVDAGAEDSRVFRNLGGAPISARIDARAQELRRQGAPRGEALRQARAEFQGQLSGIREQSGEIREARERAVNLERLLDQAERGLAGAGATGGNPVWSALRNAASSVAATFPPSYEFAADQRSKRAAESELASARQQFGAYLRIPGSGALSNYETQALERASPGEDKSPEQNRRLIDAFRIVAEEQRRYNDYLETWLAEKGSTTGAAEAWQAYKLENPAIIADETGNVLPNPQQVPWRTWFATVEGPEKISDILNAERSKIRSANAGAMALTPSLQAQLAGKIPEGRKIASVEILE